MKYLVLILLFLFCVKYSSACKKDIVVINSELPRAEKEAILILPGLGDSKKGRKHQKAFFDTLNYDLFIPNYIERKGYDETVETLTKFYYSENLDEYKAIHVFSYILGSWSINSFIKNEHPTNIRSIVYDRSPLQERAPQIIVNNIPFIGRVLVGKILKDFSEVSYQPMTDSSIQVGIIIEQKATPLVKRFKEETLKLGKINWANHNFEQEKKDAIFVRINHDEMYTSFDQVGEDILYFFEQGSFLPESKRSPFRKDPFL